MIEISEKISPAVNETFVEEENQLFVIETCTPPLQCLKL